MQYLTEIEIPESPTKIDYSSKIIMMGSCFVENIGEKLHQLKYNVDINSFGVLYNPISIANSLKVLLGKRFFKSKDLFFREGLWHSFSHHSKFSSPNKEQVLSKINEQIEEGFEGLRNADFLFLTFGTAWVYELISTGQVVSNCHKIPAAEFKRYRIPVAEITEVYNELLEELWVINPKLKVVFTVSPIRHWKDGAIENQVSKATLNVAIHNIIERYTKPECTYFPSYEIVMDELRDYRFYADDMLHLSKVAIDHIWGKFENTYIEKATLKLSIEIKKIRKALEHRPFNRMTPEFRSFISKSLKKVNTLIDKYPIINLQSEKEYFEKQWSDINSGLITKL